MTYLTFHSLIDLTHSSIRCSLYILYTNLNYTPDRWFLLPFIKALFIGGIVSQFLYLPFVEIFVCSS